MRAPAQTCHVLKRYSVADGRRWFSVEWPAEIINYLHLIEASIAKMRVISHSVGIFCQYSFFPPGRADGDGSRSCAGFLSAATSLHLESGYIRRGGVREGLRWRSALRRESAVS